MMLNSTRWYPRVLLTILMTALIFLNAYPQISLHVYSGPSFIHENLGNGNLYDVWLTSLGMSKMLFDNQKRFSIHGHLEMHYGHIMLSPQREREYDLAVNAQAELRWQCVRFAAFTFSSGTGPGFFSTDTPVQARGFTFSNNFSLGLRFTAFRQGVSIHPQVRFRHLSNGATKSPNSGIDNFLVMLGIEVPVGKRTL